MLRGVSSRFAPLAAARSALNPSLSHNKSRQQQQQQQQPLFLHAVVIKRGMAGEAAPPPHPPPALPVSATGKDHGIAPATRWLMVIPAFATHLALGSPFAWSVMSGPLSRECGVLAQSANDWSLTQATMPVSITFALHGLSAAVAGKWQLKVGPGKSVMAASVAFGTGWLCAAAGVQTHQLWLLYLGFGIMGGTGCGLGYTPPVQALIEWFPDRKGFAAGLCIGGFGSGALILGPMATKLMDKFSVAPEYLGTIDSVHVVNEAGKLFVHSGDVAKEVIIVTSHELTKLSSSLPEGVYVVGTGNTGAAATLAICGTMYAAILFASSLAIRRPPAGFMSHLQQPHNHHADGPVHDPNVERYVSVDTVMKTPQFACLAATFGFIAMGGHGLFSVAKPMMSDIFAGSFPTLVTQTFAASYVSALAAANLSGRLVWGHISDTIGRRKAFHIFTFGSIPLFFAVPFCIDAVMTSGSSIPLYGFVGVTFLAVTLFGGVYSSLPAYESDLFGSKQVGAIHGRTLLASTFAALAGPTMFLTLRAYSENKAIHGLVEKVDPTKFEHFFGAPVSDVEQLIKAKTVTIGKMMEIMPEGVADPTPFLYHNTMYALVVCMAAGTLAHYILKPVDPKYFTTERKQHP